VQKYTASHLVTYHRRQSLHNYLL